MVPIWVFCLLTTSVAFEMFVDDNTNFTFRLPKGQNYLYINTSSSLLYVIAKHHLGDDYTGMDLKCPDATNAITNCTPSAGWFYGDNTGPDYTRGQQVCFVNSTAPLLNCTWTFHQLIGNVTYDFRTQTYFSCTAAPNCGLLARSPCAFPWAATCGRCQCGNLTDISSNAPDCTCTLSPTSAPTPRPTTIAPTLAPTPPTTFAPTRAPTPLTMLAPTPTPTTFTPTFAPTLTPTQSPSPTFLGCTPGHVLAVAGECVSCSPGSFSGANTTTFTNCTQCSPGSFSATPAATSCTRCAPGMYTSVSNQTTCTECGVGEYADRTGLTRCEACAIANAAPNRGMSQCIDCGTLGLCAPTSGATGCQPCHVTQSCSWVNGTLLTTISSFPYFFSYSAACLPAQPHFASLLPFNGMAINYTTLLPLILPCGQHVIRLHPVQFGLNQQASNLSVLDTVLDIPCPSQGGLLYENFIAPAFAAAVDAFNAGNYSLGLQMGVVVTEGLAAHPPTNLTLRKMFRSDALNQLLSIASKYADPPIELEMLIQQMVSVPDELFLEDTMDSMMGGAGMTPTSVQVVLSLLVNTPPPLTPQDSVGMLERFESFADQIASLMNSTNASSSMIITMGNSTAMSVRMSAEQFTMGVTEMIGAADGSAMMSVTFPRMMGGAMIGSNTPTIDCTVISTNSKLLMSLTATKQSCALDSSMLTLSCSTPDGKPYNMSNFPSTDPLTIIFPHRELTLDEEEASCVFWDPKTGNLSTSGCTSENFPNYTICRCTHATTFSLNFLPKPNAVRIADWDNLNGENLVNHPVPLIVSCCFLFLFSLMGVWAAYRDRREKNMELRAAKAESRVENQWKSPSLPREWWIEMRTQNLWISVLKRRYGDPFTSKQRLCCLAATLFISLMFNGLFFQSKTRSIPGSIAASICAGAVSIPLVIFFSRASRLGLPSDYFITLQVDETTPIRKRGHQLQAVGYFICFACVASSFIVIIALGLQFDLGSTAPIVYNCFPIMTFTRDHYSTDWLTRCLLSLLYDILLIRPLLHMTVVLSRRYWRKKFKQHGGQIRDVLELPGQLRADE